MTWRLKSEAHNEKLFKYKKLRRRKRSQSTLLYLNSKVIFDTFAKLFVVMFFRNLCKNGKEETSCAVEWLLNKTLNISRESTTTYYTNGYIRKKAAL